MSNIPYYFGPRSDRVGNSCTDSRRRIGRLPLHCRQESKGGRLSSSKRFEKNEENSSISFSEDGFARINAKYNIVYIFFNENLVTLFTGNSRNNFIGRVAMNI